MSRAAPAQRVPATFPLALLLEQALPDALQ
jgi:hypothetical protein